MIKSLSFGFGWVFLHLIVLCLTGCRQPVTPAPKAELLPTPDERWAKVPIKAGELDRVETEAIRGHLKAGGSVIEKFFGAEFPKPFVCEIHPDRKSFDEYFNRRWKVPKTEGWMVASGVGDTLTILSPRVWKSQAVEHDSNDPQHIRDLVTHEMVHVYHGQNNPTSDFDGMDDLGWFVEGLAVYVSGQLGRSHHTAAADAIRAGKAPGKLSTAWSGKYRYGVSGSMVDYIDKVYGRETIRRLLSARDNREALEILGINERDFLKAWGDHVEKAKN